MNSRSPLRVAFANTRSNDAASGSRLSFVNRCGWLVLKSEVVFADATNTPSLWCQLGAALGPAALEYEPACFGRHAGTEPVRAGALQFAGLIRTFHLPGTWVSGGRSGARPNEGRQGYAGGMLVSIERVAARRPERGGAPVSGCGSIA